MAVLPVRIFPDPVLKEKAAPVEGVTAEVAAFIDDLLETMRCSPGGVGIAAPQVGMLRRIVIVDEGWKSGSISAEIAARLAEESLYELDAPVRRVCSREVPVPYAAQLEQAALPRVDEIVATARALVAAR